MDFSKYVVKNTLQKPMICDVKTSAVFRKYSRSLKCINVSVYYKQGVYSDLEHILTITFNIEVLILNPSSQLIERIESEAAVKVDKMLHDILSNPSKCLLLMPELIDCCVDGFKICLAHTVGGYERSISDVDKKIDVNNQYLNNITPTIERKVK